VKNRSSYQPSPENKEILDGAMAHIKSVPYKVSSRWLFYRLLQDGYYQKEDYKGKWGRLCSRARKNFYDGWSPDTLADETRNRIPRVGLFRDDDDVRSNLVHLVINNLRVTFDQFYEFKEFVIIAFEARAMAEQFLYYTDGIDLLPFGGDASIPYKWKIAKHLEQCSKWYGGKSLRILYFGDLDKKGRKIFDAAIEDISEWCEPEIYAEWCGLTKEQADRFNLPQNPEKPGQYQWEALTDSQAREIIDDAMATFNVDRDLIKRKMKQGEKTTNQWREKLRKAITPLIERR
jgi:hypothetical protein